MKWEVVSEVMVSGIYRDQLADADYKVQWDSGWRSNLIVQDCSLLLAALMKRQEGLTGILYWAVGEGEDAWDAKCPSPAANTSQLFSEIARQALSIEQIVYLGSNNFPANTLEITAEFKGEDFIMKDRCFREFGLFGGDATEKPNSGFMIDYIIHPRIDLDKSMKLLRSVRLTFGNILVQRETVARFGATLPVITIDGIGEKYSRSLKEQGIQSLVDLSRIDPSRPIKNIPAGKLSEFCTKARMVTGLEASVPNLEQLANLNIGRLLKERPEDIAAAIKSKDVTPEKISQLQQELAPLQYAMDEAQLQRIKIRELTKT